MVAGEAGCPARDVSAETREASRIGGLIYSVSDRAAGLTEFWVALKKSKFWFREIPLRIVLHSVFPLTRRGDVRCELLDLIIGNLRIADAIS